MYISFNSRIINIFNFIFSKPRQLKLLYRLSTKEYLCCSIPSSVTLCTPFTDRGAATSCLDLISDEAISKAVWIIGVIALLSNLVIVAVKVIKFWNRLESVPTFLMLNLAVSDLLLIIYVLIIGTADVVYHGFYMENVEIWLRGPFCAISCLLICLSSLISSALIVFMMVDRFICIVIPHKTNTVTLEKAKYVTYRIWIVILIFVCIPVLFSINADGDRRVYRYNSICMASNYLNPFYRMWLYTFIVAIVISWTATLYLCLHVLAVIKNLKKKVRNKRKVQQIITLKLLPIMLTNLIAWMPYFHYLLNHLNSNTFEDITLQIALLIALPLNAAIYPGLTVFANLNSISSSSSSIRRYYGRISNRLTSRKSVVRNHQQPMQPARRCTEVVICQIKSDSRDDEIPNPEMETYIRRISQTPQDHIASEVLKFLPN